MLLLFIFLFTALSASLGTVRMPIRQVDPELGPHVGGLDPPIWKQMDSYYNNIKYCHHYPDIMCYVRSGNGFSPGDAGIWLLSSETDKSGLGAVRVRFPPVLDELDLDFQPQNGWFHPSCSHPVSGVRVILTAFSPVVRFGVDAHLLYVGDVPKSQWFNDLYVEYSGEPHTRHYFALKRNAIFDNVTPPPWYTSPPPVYEAPSSTHSEL